MHIMHLISTTQINTSKSNGGIPPLLFKFDAQKDTVPKGKNYFSPNIVFTIPPSKKLEKIFFRMIKTIGPTNIPITPINLNPVYIATIVNIGCIPIFPAYNFWFYKLPNY